MIVQLAILAALLQALGYVLYARLFLKKVIRPNAASSFMFAYGTALLVLLEYGDGASWVMLALPATCAFMSIFIALLCLRKGATERVDKVEATAFSADAWLPARAAAAAATPIAMTESGRSRVVISAHDIASAKRPEKK